MYKCLEMCACEQFSFSDAITVWQQRAESD